MTTADINAEYRSWLAELAARRRFGERDRIGTANLIDDAARRRGAQAAQRGRMSSLARPLVSQPSPRGDDRPGFTVEVYYTDGPIGMGSDHVELDCHGRDNTHIDAINHIGVDRTWYAGWPVDDPDGPSVAHLAEHGLVTRGILVDVPALRGTDWVDPEHPVTAADLDAALAAGGVELLAGDALLLYMGRDRYEAAGHRFGALTEGAVMPGPGWSAARWMVDRGVSVLCWDFLDSNHPSEPMASVHLLIWGTGLILVDNCDLSTAATAAQASGTIEGCLVVAPLAIPGGTGCAVRPVFVQ